MDIAVMGIAVLAIVYIIYRFNKKSGGGSNSGGGKPGSRLK